MTRLENSFFKYSREIAEKFLQSTVVIDDWARFPGLGEEPVAIEMTTPLKRPPVGRAVTRLDEQTAEAEEETTLEDPHQLNAKKVIDGFASKGIICSIIKPDREDRDTLPESISQLSSSADIIVIDWSMHGDNGEIALQLIKQLASIDLSEHTQLRLIAIYTIDPDVAKIPAKIKADLESSGTDTISVSDDGFSLTTGPIRIVVLSKPGARIPDEYSDQKVPFEGLADRLTTEFTTMTAGLVSNIVLDSLAEIRINNHKILNNFATDLDAPYLTHRSLLANPEEAEEHIVALVAAELSAILEEKDVKANANIEAIKRWIDYKKPGDDKFILEVSPGSIQQLENALIIELLEKGISKVDETKYGLSKTQKSNPHKVGFSQMYQCTDKIKRNLDEKFAVIASLRSFYGKPVPRLNLGSIIKTTDTVQYYICIQPRCDCIRITEETNFLFLPLTPHPSGDKFNIVLWDNDEYVRLNIEKKSNVIKLIQFDPAKSGVDRVISFEQSGNYYFEDTSGSKYQWIGELKSEHALRLANEFASELSRVGPAESEWLRLYSK